MRPPAPKRGERNLLRKVYSREISSCANNNFKKNNLEERFKNFKARITFDPIHNLSSSKASLASAIVNRRSKIVEITSYNNFLFALTHAGLCAAYDRDTNTRLCYMNTAPDEIIRSLFFNKYNNSLVTVSVYRSDGFISLQCRSTHVEYIRKGRPEDGFVLFETELLRFPGFVEFDDVNGKVLTYSAVNKLYKVWDLKNYNLLFSVKDDGITEVKISPGVMLIIRERSPAHLPLTILSIETGEVLHSFQHLLHRNKRLSFVEQFNNILLVKQEGETLQILELEKMQMIQVKETEFVTPAAFVFLYDRNMFLTCRDRGITLWNFKGEPVSTFDAAGCPRRPDFSLRNAFYITRTQDLLITHTTAENQQQGAINVTDILTGRNVVQIVDNLDANVTALFYNEERNEIYVGDQNGHLYVWSN